MSSLKSTAIYLPGWVIPRAMSLAIIVVMTHFLPKDEYGLLTLVITVGELVDASLTTWVRLALLRLGGGGVISTNLAHTVLRTVAATIGAGCVISLVIAYFLIGDRFVQFWIAVATYIFGISLLRFGLALLQLRNRSVTYSLLEIGRAILSFCLATGTAYLLGAHFIYPSLAVSLTTFIFALLAIRRGLSGLSPGETVYTVKDITAFAGPLLVVSVLTIVVSAMDRLFLQSYWGAAAVGGYAATYALARQPVDVLANALNTGGYPALVGHFEKGGRTEATQFLRGQLGFFLKLILPVISVLWVVQSDIFAALLPRDYREHAGTVFGLLLLGGVAYNLRTCIFDNVFLVERRNMLQLRYFVFVFAIGVAVAFVAVPRLGLLGAALIFVTWTTLAVIMSAIVGRQLIPVTVAPVDIGRALATSAVSCALAVGARHAMLDQPAFLRLCAAGAAAAVGFSATLAGLHLDDTRSILRSLRKRTAARHVA